MFKLQHFQCYLYSPLPVKPVGSGLIVIAGYHGGDKTGFSCFCFRILCFICCTILCQYMTHDYLHDPYLSSQPDLSSLYLLLICRHPFSATNHLFTENDRSVIQMCITSSLESAFRFISSASPPSLVESSLSSLLSSSIIPLFFAQCSNSVFSANPHHYRLLVLPGLPSWVIGLNQTYRAHWFFSSFQLNFLFDTMYQGKLVNRQFSLHVLSYRIILKDSLK